MVQLRHKTARREGRTRRPRRVRVCVAVLLRKGYEYGARGTRNFVQEVRGPMAQVSVAAPLGGYPEPSQINGFQRIVNVEAPYVD